jgi:hypothetical protein
MRSSSRVRRIVTLTAAVGTGLVLVVPVGAAAGPAAPALTPVASHRHPAGFFVSGAGRVGGRRPAVLVQGSRGGEHVVTVRLDRKVSGNRGHVVYRTRRPGAKHWLTTVVPGLHPLAGIQLEAHSVSHDRKVLAVTYGCDGVFATRAGARATRLPRLTLVAPGNACGGPRTTSQDPPITHAAEVPGGPIGVLLPDPAQGDRMALWEGVPGGTFAPTRSLPTANDFVPAMVVHTTDDSVIVVGYGSDGTNPGIYFTRTKYAHTWSTPSEIATRHKPGSNYVIDGAVGAGTLWVALSLPHVSGRQQKHPIFLDTVENTDDSTGARPLQFSTSRDSDLRLAYNPASGRLHAAFTRVDPAAPVTGSGIMKEKLLTNNNQVVLGWTRPTFVTHWYRDYTDQITFTSNGGAVIGYTQR